MTDFEKVYEMLNSLDVPFNVHIVNGPGKNIVISRTLNTKIKPPDQHVTGDDLKVDGYVGFYTCYYFDENEGFERIGIWE